MEVQASFSFSAMQSTSSTIASSNPYTDEGKKKIQEEARKMSSSSVMMEYTMQFQLNISSISEGNLNAQSALNSPEKLSGILNSIDYGAIGYTGKPLSQLNQDEAKALIADDGFFGIAKTSERLSDFVINGSGGNMDLLKKGREGIERGYKEAERMWGGKLPEISQETFKIALEKIDKAIAERGGNVLSAQA